MASSKNIARLNAEMAPSYFEVSYWTIQIWYMPLQTVHITGSPSSKNEHRRASALLRNIQNIRISKGKEPIVSVTYENDRISMKKNLPYLKCVLRLSCVVHGPIYGRFMGFYVNGFLST